MGPGVAEQRWDRGPSEMQKTTKPRDKQWTCLKCLWISQASQHAGLLKCQVEILHLFYVIRLSPFAFVQISVEDAIDHAKYPWTGKNLCSLSCNSSPDLKLFLLLTSNKINPTFTRKDPSFAKQNNSNKKWMETFIIIKGHIWTR